MQYEQNFNGEASIADSTNSSPKPSEQIHFETHILSQSVSVVWDFPVAFTNDLFNPVNLTLLDAITRIEPEKQHRLLFFIDEGVTSADAQLIRKIQNYCEHFNKHLFIVCEPIVMPAGEAIKNDLQHIEKMQDAVHQHRIDRHSYVIAIGGGALLDAVGLVAATAHRGIRHIRIPTTVLSQNDSGVGVKNGVNLFGQKNYFGTFAPPFAVLNDYQFIDSLSDREKIAGMAEAVKVGLIRDKAFFNWLEQSADDLINFKASAVRHMIQRCAELHMHQIGHGGDPFEMGSARPLDFGHWAAHKLELLTSHQLRHGEAVAIGIAIDTHYSVLAGLLRPGDDERVCLLLEQLGFTLWHSALLQENTSGRLELLAGLQDFREHLGGELTITLLSDLGTGIEVNQMKDSWVFESIMWLHDRND